MSEKISLPITIRDLAGLYFTLHRVQSILERAPIDNLEETYSILEALERVKDYVNPDNDPRGPWKLVPIDANKPGGNTVYGIKNPKTGIEYFPPNKRIWAINEISYKKLFEDGRIKFGINDDSSPKKKLFYYERIEKGDSKTPSSLLLNAGTTKNGTNEIIDILGVKEDEQNR